jgi:hypothetical protein
VLDYDLLFILLSLFREGSSVCPRAALDDVPRGWVGESHVVCVAHLLGLQLYSSNFGANWWVEIACCFSQGRNLLALDSAQWGKGRLSTSLGSRMLQFDSD